MAFLESFLDPGEHTFHGLFAFGVQRVHGFYQLCVQDFLPDKLPLLAVFIMVAVAVPVASLYFPCYPAFAFVTAEDVFKERIMLEISRRAVGMHDFLAPVI
ncbi:MAG: hypothetical protein COT39_03290 [Parcubacteria group bacterium CG08_land_8_20_14_0_20_48_21]|nr:MAG: hypothetical protein AUK21_04505 [Parcubacteria group bacterium CG2_30_48_51]PIS32695.1 MAG: hypothetical protein COT39_03290 [Parcubacteria group bacterium CG08_land_8_20_14_0_20_48_21]PIW79036.1 MAG: hypothetical protein COZ99_03390 [Parcubacteria group bacterium CG_4_8_14_3_um_filter_48_16]